MTRLLKVKELSAALGISERQVWRLRSAGLIPTPVNVGGAVRWRESDIEKWIANGCRPLKAA